MRTYALAVLLALGAPAASAGDFNSDAVGTAAAQFLKLGADARGLAMGEAMGAVAEDASAIYWNPAGLAALEKRHATVTHSFMFQSVFYDFVAYAQPLRTELDPPRRRELAPSGLGTLAVGLIYVNAGALSEVDNTGTPTGGAFTPRDMALMTAWGTRVTESVDFGIGFKYIDSRIQASARTAAIDGGLRWRSYAGAWPLALSASAHHIGGQLRYREQGENLPATARLGSSLRPFPGVVLAADAMFPRDGEIYPNFGAELRLPMETVLEAALRGGWSGRTDAGDLDGLAGVSFGMGLGLRGVTLDYAWVPFGVLGHTHRISLGCRF